MEYSHTTIAGGLLCWLAHRLIILIMCVEQTHIPFIYQRRYCVVFIIYLRDYMSEIAFCLYLTFYLSKSLIRRCKIIEIFSKMCDFILNL